MAAEEGSQSSRGGPRRSLRTPIVVAVILANLVTFLVLLTATEYAARENRRVISADYADWLRDYTDWLADQLDEIVDSSGGIRVAEALNWRGWRRFEDVLLAQSPEFTALGASTPESQLTVPGVLLNPLGRAGRQPGFDEQFALHMIHNAIKTGEPVSNAFGTAAPIGLPGEAPWGGVWFRQRPIQINEFPRLQLISLFVAAMMLFTGLILLLLQRKVLDPVQHLAEVMRKLESRDLKARAEIPRRRNDEIAELGLGFNDMARRLERHNRDLQDAVDEATARVKAVEAAAMTQRRLAATGELAAGVAHELNNPLGGLTNAVEALSRDSITPERRKEYLSLVSSGLARMGETVGRLLRLAPRESQLEGVDLARPLGDALGLVRHRAEGMNVDLQVAGPGPSGSSAPRPAFEPLSLGPFDSLPQIRGAANELGQAILNLFVNALDAIGEARAEGRPCHGPGRIELSMTGAPTGAIHVVCRDDGPGVDDKVLGRAADAFFTTKEQGKGTGLGLAIVHNVVAAHGGRVLLESRPGEGFTVT